MKHNKLANAKAKANAKPNAKASKLGQASLRRRILAYYVDLVLANSMAVLLCWPKSSFAYELPAFFYSLFNDTSQILPWKVAIVVFLIAPLPNAFFTYIAGRSPGQLLLGLRLACYPDSSREPGLMSCLINGYTVAWSLWWLHVPLAIGLTQPRYRHLGNLLSGTQVTGRTTNLAPADPSGRNKAIGKLGGYGLVIALIVLWVLFLSPTYFHVSLHRQGLAVGGSKTDRQAFLEKESKNRALMKGLCLTPEACFKHYKELLKSRDLEQLLFILTPRSQRFIEMLGREHYIESLPSPSIVLNSIEKGATADQLRAIFHDPSEGQTQQEDFIVFVKEGGSWRIDWFAYMAAKALEKK